MIADQNFYDTCFTIFYPTALATAYGWRPNFFMAEHSATAKGENCAYGPTLIWWNKPMQQSVADQKGQQITFLYSSMHQNFWETIIEIRIRVQK